MTTRPPRPWTTEIGLRMRRHFWLKFLGTTAVVWIFFLSYFYLLRHPAYPVTLMPLSPIDHLVPFEPSALYAYLSLWLYVGIAPGLQLGFRELLAYGSWAGGLCVTGLALFYFWPTAVPPPGFDISGHPGFRMLQGVDAAGNACPSMHVAFAMFTAIWLEHLLNETRAPRALHAINVAWFVAIVWSTLAIRQHVALDVLAGLLLGIAFAVPSLRWRPRPAHTGLAAFAGFRADIIGRTSTDTSP